jgi:hypothetical protein
VQLELPLDAPTKQMSDIERLLSGWDDEDEIIEPALEPAAPIYTAATLKKTVSDILDTGGLMSFGDLRDAIWPDEDFGSSDPRYATLVNSVRDLHSAAAITAFGRRYSSKGNLAGIQYTKFPELVSIVWTGSETSK